MRIPFVEGYGLWVMGFRYRVMGGVEVTTRVRIPHEGDGPPYALCLKNHPHTICMMTTMAL